MRHTFISLSIAVLTLSRLTASEISEMAILPGFDLGNDVIAPLSATDLSPSVTFSVAMNGAFLTPDGIKLGIISSATSVTPWGGARSGSRRVRSVIGYAANAGVAVNSDSVAPAPSTSGSVSQIVAVPEPGTFLTGALLMGLCAGARGRRGSRA